MHIGRLLAAVAVVTLTACTHFKPPERGGPQWTRAVTEHFIIVTDLPDKRLEALARDLEQPRQNLEHFFFPGWPSAPAQIEVIALRSAGEYKEITQHSIPFVALPDALGNDAVLLQYADDDELRDALLYSGLARYLLLSHLRAPPAWLLDGVSIYATSSRIDEKGRLVLGEAPRLNNIGLNARREALIQFTFGLMTQKDFDAWARVHYLIEDHTSEFFDYLARLRDLDDSNAAFRAAFPSIPPNLLGVEVKEYLRTHAGGRTVGSGAIPVSPWITRMTTETLSPSEVHALFARLFGRGRQDLARAKEEAAAALALDQNEPTAWLEGPLQDLSDNDRWQVLRRLAEAHPNDARPLLLLALNAYPGSEQRETALRQAMKLPPHLAAPPALLSLELVARTPDEALTLADEAVALAPSNEVVRLVQAAARAATGRCELAQATLAEYHPKPWAVRQRSKRADDATISIAVDTIKSACGPMPSSAEPAAESR